MDRASYFPTEGCVLKVVVLASYAESLINFRSYFLQSMVSHGHQVYAVAPHIPDHIAQQLRALGVEAVSVDLQRTGKNPFRDWQSYRALLDFFRREKPDRLFSYTAKPVIYGSLAGQKAGIGQIYSMITGLGYAFMGRSVKDRMIGWIVRLLYRRALRVNEKVFFQNPDDRELFLRLGLLHSTEQSVMVNGSGISLDYFQPIPLPDQPIFLLVARLLRDKGIVEYVQASARLKKRYPQARFLLVGWFDSHPTAIQSDEVDMWQQKMGIEYLGSTDDVRLVMSKSSVYVLPSYREGTPRTVLEAMAMARPLITTDAPGCRETVEDGFNGLLVPVGDDSLLESAMEKLLNDRFLREMMGNNGRKLAEQKYDVHKVNHRLLETMGLLE